MLLKFHLMLSCLALLVIADNSIESAPDPPVIPPTETRVESSVSFETSHKRPDDIAHENDDGDFQTSHKVGLHKLPSDIELNINTMNDLTNLQTAMNLLPTKERPELNPILSALINEDVMKSIEAKRAIEQEELEFIRAEAEQQAAAGREEESTTTEAGVFVLTTAAPVRKIDLDDDAINVGFVDQSINLDAAGSENNKKSRIEIKKGPNGQDYEYEYVYYYEDDEDDSKAKASETVAKAESDTARGKSRYSNIDRSTTASAADNSLVNTKAKGRSSNVAGGSAAGDDDIEAERLPSNTRFPSRKSIETQPTPALDSLENAAEKKKISVKRPSLELVDSETFNTDEKQVKGTRNGDTEAKPVIAIEQEQAQPTAAAAAAKAAAEKSSADSKTGDGDESATEKSANDEDVEQTTPSMEKAALDLYAILANENFNMDMTTDADMDVTTLLPDTTNADGDVGLTTLLDEESSSTTSTTTTTTTTTTEAPTTTTTTTTTTTAAPLFGGRRHGAGLPAAGRNRFKLKQGGTGSTTTSTTEPPPSAEPPKTGKNRFSRPSIGGRNRASFKTTAAPAEATAVEEEEVAVKEVKPVSSGFGRGRPRNRFNLRGSTTTEKPSGDAEEAAAQDETPSSTTARTLRGRPTLNLRGRSRTTTTKAPASEESSDNEAAPEEKSSAPAPSSSSPARPSRFNIQRPGGNRLLPRGKLGRTTEVPAASDDSTADSSHHNDIKGEGSEENAEKSEAEAAPTASHSAGGLNRLKSRSRLNNNLQKTDNSKSKVAPAPIAPRKVNPLLAKRRLQLGHSTTETAAVEDDSSTASEESEPKDETTSEDNESTVKDDATEETEATTKQQPPRGLGLLGQRRRLPARKPGTIL